MDMKSIEYFLKIADEKSISRVAERLYISQPALSLQIKKLEEHFQQKLLIRTTKGVELTEAGIIFTRYANNIHKLYNQSLEEMNQLNDSFETIRIDANITLATYALPCMVHAMQENPKFQDYLFDMTFSTDNSVEDNIFFGISDVGYVNREKPNPALSHSLIGEDRLVLVAAPNYDTPDTITVAKLEHLKLIELYDKFQERLPLKESLEKSGHQMNDFKVFMTLHSTESVKTCVFKGFGVSFLPFSSVKKELSKNQLKEITVSDFEESYPVYLVYLKENENSLKLAELISYLKSRKMLDFC
jgi:DNA-binding transcriptional LysR family regulator